MREMRFVPPGYGRVVIVALGVLHAAVCGASDVASPDFQSDVLPLLKARCVACHGPAKREAGLNLALPAGIRRGGESGAAIVTGSPERSLIWQRVAADEMPVDEPLSPEDKDKLQRWIRAGAPGLPERVSALPDGDEHWAFQALRHVPLPHVADESRVRTALDRFVQSRLESVGLSIGPEADRETLIRRVSFDLTGLPPSPSEHEAFLNDTSDRAYESMVDRYLDSPRFGERWGKYWLDAAGYADSNGYFSADTDRPLAYRYRDYVIRSLNDDKPWDQFIREQLAGDELAGYGPGGDVQPEMTSLLEAAHYLRNSPDGTDSSDGNPDEVRRDKYAVLEGTLEIMGSSLFGMSVGCARCHDHKFEPFTQRDYYQLQAVLYPSFNVAEWVQPKDRIAFAATAQEIAAWKEESRKVDELIATRRTTFGKWLREHRERGDVIFSDDFEGSGKLAGNWSNTAPHDTAPAGRPAVNVESPDAPAARIEDGALRIVESGSPGDRALSTVQSFDWTPAEKGDWIQVTFDLLPQQVPAPYVGYFLALRDFNDVGSPSGGNVLFDGAATGGAAIHVDYPGADSQARGKIGSSGYVPGHNYGVRITNIGDGKFAVVQLVDWLEESGTATLDASDLPDGGFGFEFCCGRSFTVDNVLVERSQSDAVGQSEQAKAEQAKAERAKAGQAKAERAKQVEVLQQKRAEFEADVSRLNAQRPAEPARLAIVTDLSAKPPQVPMLVRGDHKSPGESVAAAAPHVLVEPHNAGELDAGELDPTSDKPMATTGRRLAFARWLTRPDSRASSLLARVTVNRWWQYHFGRGIVATVDNLGYSGAAPTHPDLLEFLAGYLAGNGWKLKDVHRLVLRSAVYRQASTPRESAQMVDPDNQLLWRYPFRRLDAEALRDAMLAVSGELDMTMFGPYVPTEFASHGSVVVKANAEGVHRRSIYLQQRRTQIPAMLQVFDAPSIVASCTGRARTTVPLQSLNLLNSPFIRDRSAAMADRLDSIGKADNESFVRGAFVLALARLPGPSELSAAMEFLARQPDEYPGAPDAIRRARVDFCHMMLASNPFLFIE